MIFLGVKSLTIVGLRPLRLKDRLHSEIDLCSGSEYNVG
jgi:hypothetical protein